MPREFYMIAQPDDSTEADHSTVLRVSHPEGKDPGDLAAAWETAVAAAKEVWTNEYEFDDVLNHLRERGWEFTRCDIALTALY